MHQGTANVHFLLPIVVTTCTAKLVGNLFGHEGVYEIGLRRKKLRFLEHEPSWKMVRLVRRFTFSLSLALARSLARSLCLSLLSFCLSFSLSLSLCICPSNARALSPPLLINGIKHDSACIFLTMKLTNSGGRDAGFMYSSVMSRTPII
jgi:hypothetical protein